jgi:transcriptional regulator of arginine metabolism
MHIYAMMLNLYADMNMASSSEHTLTGARREALRQIITRRAVGRQEDLVRLLAHAGHRATQSSVSRDLRELGVAKLGDRYVLPDETPAASGGFAAVAGFVRQVQPAGASLTVVHTSAGAAQSVAIVLDRAQWPEVIGTISGDDTIFIATAGAAAQRRLLTRLHDIFRV